MTDGVWSAVLQWSRLGVNAAVFLIAARFLTLEEIGAFATAFAPIRLAQVVHKAGVADAAVLLGRTGADRDGLFALSLAAGLSLSALFAAIGLWWGGSVGPMLTVLAVLPLVHGVSAVSEGIMRQGLRVRALALRTLAAQSLAAIAALGALAAGQGVQSLVIFALVNALVTAALSLVMADWRPRPGALLRPLPLRVPAAIAARITLRDLAANTTFPVLQMAIALVWGLPAAGAFQIATRMLSLMDALALSPLRYLALPRFAGLGSEALGPAVLASLRLTSGIAAWLYPGAMLAAPQILTLVVGPAHAGETAGLMAALCLLGLTGAIAMPLTQGLTAMGQSRIALSRAVWTMTLSLALSLAAVLHSPLAAALALPLAATLALGVYACAAVQYLGFTPMMALRAIFPAIVSGAVMTLVLLAIEPALIGQSTWLILLTKVCVGTLVHAGGLALWAGGWRRMVLAA